MDAEDRPGKVNASMDENRFAPKVGGGVKVIDEDRVYDDEWGSVVNEL